MSISRDLSKFIAPSGQLEYDNTTSGLSATTIKSAIDELNTLLGGGNVGSQATFNVYEFTATASQTTFSLSSNHGQGSDITAGNFVDGTTYIITSVGTTDFVTLYGASSNTVGVTFTANTNPGTGTGTAKVVADYIPGFIKVYLNGVLLSETDYVASDGDNVVLDVGADVGALLSVVVLDSFNTATQLRVLGIDAGAPDNSVTVDASGNLDVAGTVTADGLTVETNTTSAVTISEDTGSGVAELRFIATEAFPKTKIVTDVSAASLTLETLGSDRLKIANNGDISFYEATGTTAKLFWDASAESLGIGTLTPAELLHIESGTNGEQVDIRFRGLTTSAGAGRSANIGFDPDPNDTGTASEAQLYLSADTTNKTLVATAAGDVGIGTSTPTFSTGSGLEIQRLSATATLRLEYTGANGYEISAEQTQVTYNSLSSLPHVFEIASSPKMTLDASGNLLVGRSAASDTRLHVEEVADKSESAAHFQITGSGYSAFHWLDANGYYIGQNSATRSLRLYSSAETAGAQLSAGATSFTTFSDERLKENVEPVENALQSLSGLRTVKYHLKDVDSPEDKKKIGVIAQDLVGVIDEVIDPTFRTGDDIEYMGIRYTELVPVLIKAIQEQQDLIESLTARIAALESN